MVFQVENFYIAKKGKQNHKMVGQDFTIIDLYCGVGGLTLAAMRAGFKVSAAVDNDLKTKRTFEANFPNCNHIDCDISGLSGSELRKRAGLENLDVHGIIGGSPCQGFSRLGKRAPDDERNCLFDHFFRLVSEVRPWFYMAENVPGILDIEFDSMRQEALSRISNYKQLSPIVLNASDFGAATSRERVFFIGYRPDCLCEMTEDDFSPPPDIEKVNVKMALQGLRRKINPDWQSEKQGWRPLTCRPEGVFWSKVFGEVPDGIGETKGLKLLNNENRVSGCVGTRHTEPVKQRFINLPQGAVDRPSRAVRLKNIGLCPTLRSGTGPDKGSFQALRPIHPTEPRVITPREAARLQGFPDWFQFDATKWHSFRQIGNSVSPIIAENLLRTIHSKFL